MNGIIKISTNYNETTNTACMLAISGSYMKASFNVLSMYHADGTQAVNKVRCVNKDNNIYFDALYYYNSSNNLYYNTNCYVQDANDAIYSKDYDVAYSVEESDYDYLFGEIQL